jgi:proteasome assembly chaperone (PAC2) family protein
MKLFEDVQFEVPPTMLAAWQGMGNVGLITMDYLRRKTEAKPFAEIDMSHFLTPDSIVVKEGIAQFPDIPTSTFHYVQSPALVVFESNAQVGGRDGISIIKTILDVANRFNVKRIFTSAAFAQPMSHRSESNVLVACNNESMLRFMEGFEVAPMPDGYIAGLNGLLLGVAASRNIEAACLLGTIPSYATGLSYPKASVEILRVFQHMFDLSFELDELEAASEEMDQQLAAIEDRIREFFPSITEKDEELTNVHQDEVPQYIMDKIERLFEKVAADRSKANDLKDELVRWNLYELYEKRFLDLFKHGDD